MLQHQLPHKWNLWNCYAALQKDRGDRGHLNSEDYEKNLEKVLTFSNLTQVSYFFSESKLSDLSNYFADPEALRAPKYSYLGENRRLQAISLFKDPIQPTWEYGANGEGGQFFETVLRTSKEKVNNLYSTLILQIIFERFSFAEEVLGIRFVERTNLNKGQFSMKVEIWVGFNDFASEKRTLFMKQFGAFCKESELPFKELTFKNNR